MAAGAARPADQRRADRFRLSGMGAARPGGAGAHRRGQPASRRRLGPAPAAPFPVPSYASEAFYSYVGGWYDAVCPIIARHLAPGGCVVAVQSDNETCYLFHDQTYATDYSPDSLALYRAWLAARYGDIAALNTVYGAELRRLRAGRAAARLRDHRAGPICPGISIGSHIKSTRSSTPCRPLRRGCCASAASPACRSSTTWPTSSARRSTSSGWRPTPASTGWASTSTATKRTTRAAVRQTRYLAGSTRLPFRAGIRLRHLEPPPAHAEPEDHELITLGTLMHGLKAFNLYMLVERERWQGSPITRHGALRPEYADFYARLTAFLHRYRFWRFRRDRQVLVLRNYDLGRYAAATGRCTTPTPICWVCPPSFSRADVDLKSALGRAAEADEHRCDTWFGTLGASLPTVARLRPGRYTRQPQRLAKYSLIFLSAADFMDLNDQQRILEAVAAGATVVVGPGLPYTDPDNAAPRHPGPLPERARRGALSARGRLIWAEQADLPKLISLLAPTPEFRCSDPAIALTVWRNDEYQVTSTEAPIPGRPSSIVHSPSSSVGKLLRFAANPTAQARTVCLTFEGERTLRAVWRSEELLTGRQSVDFELQPYAVSIWEVERD